jgi:type I restriction-modification system DNA methylase subunit
MNFKKLENELWKAADQLHANYKLTAAEYAMPAFGLIFFRHAEHRFKVHLPDIEADIRAQVPASQREALIKLGFQSKAAKEFLEKLGIGKLQIDYWREKVTVQTQVKAEIIKHLSDNLPTDAYDADEINLNANAVFADIYTAGLAKAQGHITDECGR